MSRATLRARLESADPLCAFDMPDGSPCGCEAEFHLPGDDHKFVAPDWVSSMAALLALADAVADAIDGCDLCDETYVCSAHKDMNAALAAVEALP